MQVIVIGLSCNNSLNTQLGKLTKLRKYNNIVNKRRPSSQSGILEKVILLNFEIPNGGIMDILLRFF